VKKRRHAGGESGYPAIVDDPSAREIEAAVQEALGLFGTSGSVSVQGRQIALRGRGAPVAIDLEQLVEQWPLLPQELRTRKASDIARRLAQAHRAVSSLAPPAPVARVRPARHLVIPVGALALVVVVALFASRMLRSREAPAASPTEPETTSGEDAARNARTCEAARKRIYAGASMGPFELAGWVAELWLAMPRGAAAAEVASGAGEPPALTAESVGLGALIAQGKLTSGADAELAAITDGVVEIVPGFDAEEARRSPSWRAITARFSGGYARAYFDPAHRARFVALGDRMADAADAALGALYARCAHLPYHDAGAWFRGSDPAAAATALVYASGLFAEMSAVDRGALAGLPGVGPIDALRGAGASLDAASLGKLVGAHGGGITKGGTGAVVITFPVGGPTRATTASRTVARKLQVGVGQE
jgi:serine/threonine-protein kinase